MPECAAIVTPGVQENNAFRARISHERCAGSPGREGFLSLYSVLVHALHFRCSYEGGTGFAKVAGV